MSLSKNLRILVGMLFGLSLSPWFKKEIILKTTVLSVGVIKVESFQNIILGCILPFWILNFLHFPFVKKE